MEEEEMRKCPICDKTLDFCHSHGEKQFCLALLSDLKENKITNKEFMSKLGEKINVDELVEYVVKNP